jgi:hypothetical protein
MMLRSMPQGSTHRSTVGAQKRERTRSEAKGKIKGMDLRGFYWLEIPNEKMDPAQYIEDPRIG